MDGFIPNNVPVEKEYLLEQPQPARAAKAASGGVAVGGYAAPELDAHAQAVEQKYGLPSGLIVALKNAGERSNADQVSPAGARGVMQFMPENLRKYGVKDATDSMEIIDAAGRYLKDTMQQYGGNVRAVIADYNGGPANAKAVLAGKEPVAAETRDYLKRVESFLSTYSGKADTGTLQTTAKKPPTWSEVVKLPQMQRLSTDQLEAARNQYFSDVVAPVIQDPEQMKAARSAFDKDTAPSMLGNVGSHLSDVVKSVRKGLFGGPLMQESDGQPVTQRRPQDTISPLQWNDPKQFEQIRQSYMAMGADERDKLLSGIDPATATIQQNALLAIDKDAKRKLGVMQGGVAAVPEVTPETVVDKGAKRPLGMDEILHNKRVQREADKAVFVESMPERIDRYKARGISPDVAMLMATADNNDLTDRSKDKPQDKGLATDLANAASDMPTHVKAALARYFKGTDQVDRHSWIGRTIREADQLAAERTATPGGMKKDDPKTKSWAGEVRDLPSNVGFSAVAMLAGIGGMTAGSVLGTPGAIIGGAATSGHAAYRMDTSQFADELRKAADQEAIAKSGRRLTDAEWQEKQGQFRSLITEHGLWEAIPELIGNATGIGMIANPMRRIFGKTVAERFITKMGTQLAVETATEATTQMGQHNVEVKAGLSNEPLRQFTNLDDWKKSVEEVFPQTVMLTLTLGVLGGAAGRVKGKFDDVRDTTLIKGAAQEPNGLKVIPDTALPRLVERADELAAGDPKDDALQAAAKLLHDEADRRAKEAPAQPAPGAKPAKRAASAPVTADDLLGKADTVEQPEAGPAPKTEEVTRIYGGVMGKDKGEGDVFANPDPVDAKAGPSFVDGRETKFSTERGSEISGRFAVADAPALTVSHDINFEKNPAFPQQLQPRDRERAGYAVQVENMVNRLNPERLGDNPLASDGAPIVGADGIVESGNGRMLALLKAYNRGGESADKYRNWLIDNAEKFGLTPDAIKGVENPVLVRVRSTPVNRAEFTRQANASATAALSPLEVAKADASRMGSIDDFTAGEGGEFSTDGNTRFIKRFVATLPVSEQTGMVDGKGRLSQQGYTRIRNAVLARAYGNSPTLMRLVESVDDSSRNITKALLQSAPRIAKLREDIKDGALHDLDITGDMIAAVEELTRLREQGKNVGEVLAQMDMLGGKGYSPETIDLLAFLHDNIRAPRRIAALLDNYLNVLQGMGSPQQSELVPRETTSKADVLAAAKKGLSDEQGESGLQPQVAAAPKPAESAGKNADGTGAAAISGAGTTGAKNGSPAKGKGGGSAKPAKRKPVAAGGLPKPTATPTATPTAKAVGDAFGAGNKVFTKDKADAARAKLRAKLSQLNTGIDPEVIQAGIELAGYYIEGGARTFADYSAKMIGDLGEAARPYLKSWYLAVRNYPGFDNAGMQSEAEIEAKPAPAKKPIAKKETPAKEPELTEAETDAQAKARHEAFRKSVAESRKKGAAGQAAVIAKFPEVDAIPAIERDLEWFHIKKRDVKSLTALLTAAEKDVASDIKVYNEYRSQGIPRLSDHDIAIASSGDALEALYGALNFKKNHVSYNRGKVLTIALAIRKAGGGLEHHKPDATPTRQGVGDRWTADRGAIPGEPYFTLDENAETGDGKAYITETEVDGKGAVWTAALPDGTTRDFSALEEAAKWAESKTATPAPDKNKGRVKEWPTKTGRANNPIPFSTIPLTPEQKEVETRFRDWVWSNLDGAVMIYRKGFVDSETLKGFDNLINTDDARELSPDYSASNDGRSQHAASVHEAASFLTKEIYKRMLAAPVPKDKRPLVLFSAGGTGAGKTSGMKGHKETARIKESANIIYDTNTNSEDSAKAKIDDALNASRDVVVLLTHRDVIDAFTKGALPRAMSRGRTVSIQVHKDTHDGAIATFPRLMAHYANDKRVTFRALNNSFGKGNQKSMPVEKVADLPHNIDIKELQDALETEYKAGRISETVYRGTLGGAAQAEQSGLGATGGRNPADSVEQPDTQLDAGQSGSPVADAVDTASNEAASQAPEPPAQAQKQTSKPTLTAGEIPADITITVSSVEESGETNQVELNAREAFKNASRRVKRLEALKRCMT